jgi:hypothetical protein
MRQPRFRCFIPGSTLSSGFAAAVMEAVREVAGEPPPLPFPWRRFAAGLFGCSISAASGIAAAARIDWSILSGPVAQLRAVTPELACAAVVVVLSLGFVRVQQTFSRA